MKNQITDTRLIKEFKETIIPGIFKQSFNSLIKEHGFNGMIKVSGIFDSYVNGLEAKGLITSKQSQSLDLKWVKEIEKLTF